MGDQGGRSSSSGFQVFARKSSETQVTFVPACADSLWLASMMSPIVSDPGGEIALKFPVACESASFIIHAVRSRTSMTWIGSRGVPGASISPPRDARTGQYVKRSVGSSGPTIYPGRTMLARPANASRTYCSHSAFIGPYVSPVTSS